MGLIKAKQLLWQSQDDQKDALFVSHCLDMVRKQEMDNQNGLVYVWQKSEAAQDHYMHTLGYLHVACRLMPTASRNVSFVNVPIARRIKVATVKEAQVYGSLR